VEGDFKIGEWLVSPALNQISTNGKKNRVEPKAMQVLLQLAKAGGVVNKERLISAVWPDVFVSDDVLPGCVASLRRAFDDSARNPQVIETIPKSGYRILLPVEWSNGNSATPSTAILPPARKVNRMWGLIVVAVVGCIVAALATWGLALHRSYESVAILPLVNATADPETQYLSDGISESVIDDLSQATALRVMAWTTVSRYRSAPSDIRDLGRQLGVNAVFTGRLRRQGDRLVVQTELTDAATGRHLWGKQYDSPISDLLGLQGQLAEDIATNLRVHLTGADERKIVSHYRASPEAYQLYLKGRLFWNERNRESLLKAIYYFEQAIKIDPKYALAYSGLADSYNLLDDWGSTPPRDSFPKARDAAEKALSLDDSLAEAHTSLAQFHGSYEWNWKEAEREYRRAIELNPNYATAHQWYAMFLCTQGRFREAEEESQRAYRLDPLAPPIAMTVAEVLDYQGRYDEAIAQYKKLVEVSPNFTGGWGNLSHAYEEKGMYQEAIDAAKKEAVLSGQPEVSVTLEQAFHTGGHTAVVRAMVNYELQHRREGKYASAMSIAAEYAQLGDADNAFRWIEEAYKDHSSSLPYIAVHSEFKGIRNDPRFRYWLQTLGLPDADSARR
jgi:TolB-like protein/DNA-binding winged helix-turn-helix (wHTH) protein/tetratricopeptide (TPR) repeat protein